MTIRTNTLNVTQQTSIDQLRGFLDKAGDDSRIRGEKLPDGTVRLYSKPDKTGFMARLQSLGPNARKHREIGREAIKQIFTNQPRKAGETLNANVRSAVDPGFARDMKGGAIKLLGTMAARTDLRMDGDDLAAKQNARPSPKLADCGLSHEALTGLLRTAAADVAQGGDPVTAGATLGKALAKAFDATHPSAKAREDFAFSLGGDLQNELIELLRPSIAGDPALPFESMAPSDRKALANLTKSAVNAASANVLDDRMSDDNKTLTLGGKSYAQVRTLGQGGFGTVDLFVNVNDATDKIAVKVPTVPSGGDFSDMQDMIAESLPGGVAEMEAHRAIEGSGHDNIVALRGAVRCPNGGMAIALEYCESGDLTGMTEAIDLAVTSGSISPERAMAAKATLAKDYLQGVAHAHAQGMANRDLKPDNMFITGAGVLKVGDQGGGRSAELYNAKAKDSQTPHFVSPEVSVGATTALTRVKAGLVLGSGDAANAVARDRARQIIDQQMPNLSSAKKAALLQSYEGAVAEEVLAKKFDPRNRDLYAVGGSLLAVARGQNIHHGQGGFAITASLQAAFDNPDRDVVQDLNTGTRSDASWGNANAVIRDFNDLANRLMKTDPTQRLSAAEALQHRLFTTTPGLDSAEARADIRLAASLPRGPAAPPLQATQAPPALTGSSGGSSSGDASALPLLRTTVGPEDADDMLASIARERSASILV